MLEITKDDGTGSTWEYSCFYQEDKDCLAPISSSRINFTTDLNTGDRIPGETAYDGDEEKGTEFTIDADGTCTVFKKNAEGNTSQRMTERRTMRPSPRRKTAGCSWKRITGSRWSMTWKSMWAEVIS